jgi:hypothetical protein
MQVGLEATAANKGAKTMKTNRRGFIRMGAAAAVGATAGCSSSKDTTAQRQAKQLSLVMQFSGLLMHGAWPLVDSTVPFVYKGWDALLVESKHHTPVLKIRVDNVNNAVGYTPDRYNPDLGIWDIKGMDVIVKLDGKEQGEVSAIHGKRQTSGGNLNPCPDLEDDGEFLDITWLADLDKIFADGTIKKELKESPSTFPPKTVQSRVRLPKGSMACARPTNAAFEKMKLGYQDTNYARQFTSDLTRFTSDVALAITLELVPFAGGSTTTLELVATGSGPIRAFVENHDLTLGVRTLKKGIKEADYWAHHFLPYHRLMTTTPDPKIVPILGCCSNESSCDPPFYCVPPKGKFA